MKRFMIISLLMAAVMIAMVCCSELQRPVDLGKGAKQDDIVTSTQPLLGSFPPFSDDFEAGLDLSVWYRELVNGAQWTHMTEGGNGYIHAPAQNPPNWGNRFTDILAFQEDFDDFTFTWDMRFLNQGVHKDRRYIYFRSDGQFPYPHGYLIHTAVGYPYGPTHWLIVQKFYPDGSQETISPQIQPPWALNQWFSFKLEANGNVFKLKFWVKGDPEPEDWALEVVDPASSFSSGRIGFGNYLWANTDVDNVAVSPFMQEVYFDIKPGSCPNPLNVTFLEKGQTKGNLSKKGGVLPAAILGTENFDVYDIDVSTLRLEGVPPIHSSYEDVAAPGVNIRNCECTTADPDENMDLALKFSKIDIITALGPVSQGDLIQVTLTGKLLDGSDFEGMDCLLIVGNLPTPSDR